jgi:hypothetical protein
MRAISITILFLACVAKLSFAGNLVTKKLQSSLHFVQNHGQWDESVAYRATLPGAFLHVKNSGELLYSFYDAAAVHKHIHPHGEEDKAWRERNPTIAAHGVGVSFLGSSWPPSHKNIRTKAFT